MIVIHLGHSPVLLLLDHELLVLKVVNLKLLKLYIKLRAVVERSLLGVDQPLALSGVCTRLTS